MKFKNDKERAIYYWEKAKAFKEKGEEEAFKEYLAKANELVEKIEKEDRNSSK